MGKLIVCGDSHMSPSDREPGTHFSELVANHLGYELIPYSRGGISNGGIAIQIDNAIKNKPDLILVGTTYYDRIEFSVEDSPQESCGRKVFTVKDIDYKHSSSLSSLSKWADVPPTLISRNLHELLDDSTTNIFSVCKDPIEKKKAVSNWFKYMYSPSWKRQTDEWIMYAILHKLHLSNIPYILCVDNIDTKHAKCFWLENSINNVVSQIDEIRTNGTGSMLVYHTSADTQKEIAEYLINHINLNFKKLLYV